MVQNWEVQIMTVCGNTGANLPHDYNPSYTKDNFTLQYSTTDLRCSVGQFVKDSNERKVGTVDC